MLRKSHRGATSILNPRYFVSDGFHVMYFESEARTKRHGARRASNPAPWPPHNVAPALAPLPAAAADLTRLHAQAASTFGTS
eukprot:scaffold112274_cov48-Phaeocystis_antarctica.AAC.3